MTAGAPAANVLAADAPLWPCLAGACYPWVLSGVHALAPHVRDGALSATLVLCATLAAPALGLWALLPRRWPARERRRLPGLALFVAPPLYTLLGVECYLFGIDRFEGAIWLAGWLLFAAWAWRMPPHAVLAVARVPFAPLRVAHGALAAVLVVGFIGLHLANHAAGLVSAEMHLTIMHALRHWYRQAWVEPVLVALMLLQVVTGAALARRWLLRGRLEHARALQVATGVYLGVYLLCHLNSTFIYARAVEGIDTDFWFASGGQGGLMASAWNVRLVPHYLLAVFALVLHLSLGLRVVLIAHGFGARRLAWLAPTGACAGLALACAAVLPLLRVHLS